MHTEWFQVGFSVLLTLLIILFFSGVIFLRLQYVKKKHPEANGRLCGCPTTCDTHLYQIEEPQPHQ